MDDEPFYTPEEFMAARGNARRDHEGAARMRRLETNDPLGYQLDRWSPSTFGYSRLDDLPGLDGVDFPF